MRKSKKTLAILTIIAMVLMMVPVQAFADNAAAPTRLAGSDRIDTAIAIANQGWANGASTVIVAPADDANLVDALAVAPVAGQLNAPILMTYKDSLDSRVQAEIGTLKATKVIAVGALSANAVSQLKAISGVTVDQVQGADRFGTASQLAAMLTNPAGTFVVAYNGLADAMSAASYAAANNYAIMIADTNGALPSSETAVGSKTYTVGGQVAAIAGATSFAGADRYATNDAVLNGLSYQYSKVYVANGETLVDALAGSALAAQTKSPIVLANTSGAAAAADVNKDMTASSQVVAFGGTAVVPDSVVNSIVTGGTVTPPPAAAGLSVTATMAGASTVVSSQALVNIGTVNMTASGSDAVVNGINLTRTGLSKDTDVKNIYIWNGATRLNAPAILSNGVATIGFTTPLTVKAGTTVSLKITGDIDSGAATGEQIIMSLAGTSAISTSATVSGSFPFTSGLLTVSTSITLGTLSVTTTSDTPSGNISASAQAVSLAKFKFSASNEDQYLNTVTFTDYGSASDADVTNLQLFTVNGQIGDTASVQNRKVTFTFDPAIKIVSGSSLNVELKGDTQASFAGRSVQFGIDNNDDVQAVGGTYGTTIALTGTAPYKANSLSAAQGSLTASIDASSPTASTISVGSAGDVFSAIKVQASNEPVQIQKITLQAATNNTGGGTPKYNDLQNVTITSGDLTLVKAATPFSSSNSNQLTLSTPITVTPGTPVVLKISADVINTSTALSGDTYTIAVTQFDGRGNITGNDVQLAQNFVSNLMSVGSTNVTYAFGTGTAKIFPNQSGVTVANINLSDNLSKEVDISQLNLQTTAAVLSNLRIADTSGNAISNTISNVTTGSDLALKFTTPIKIAVGQTVSVNVVADVVSNATTGAVNTISLDSSGNTSAMTAYTPDNGNSVNSAATSGLSSQNCTVGVYVGDNYLTATTSAIANLSNSTVGLGATNVKIAAATLAVSTSNEPVVLKKLTLALISPTSSNGDISNVRVVDGSGNVLANVGSMPSTALQVTLSTPLVVPASGKGTAEIAVLGDFTTALAGIGHNLTMSIGTAGASLLPDLTYNGQYSGLSKSTTNNSLYNTVKTVTESIGATSVSVAKVPLSTTDFTNGSSGVVIGSLSITNNGTQAITLQQLGLQDILNSSTSGLSTNASTTSKITIVDANTGAVYYSSNTAAFNTTGGALGLSGDTTYYQQVTLTSAKTIGAGQTITMNIILSTNSGITTGAIMLKEIGALTTYQVPGTSTYGNFSGTNALLDSISFHN